MWQAVHSPFAISVSFMLGLIVGSFCNVCIHRIPLGENIVVPRSRCPNCRDLIRAYDNIPLFSFLFLKISLPNSCVARIHIRSASILR